MRVEPTPPRTTLGSMSATTLPEPDSTSPAPTSPLAVRPPPALLRSNGLRYDWIGLVNTASNGLRETIMRTGTAPTFESLVGWEFRGANGSVLTRLIGIRKFAKGFYEGPDRAKGPTPHIQGYNVIVRQNADEAPHLYSPSDEKPHRHGYYRVHAPVAGARDSYYPNALLLDYGLGGNGPFGPPLRDYIVQVYPDNPDLLLGKAYVALGPLRIPVGFFILERYRQHDHKG